MHKKPKDKERLKQQLQISNPYLNKQDYNKVNGNISFKTILKKDENRSRKSNKLISSLQIKHKKQGLGFEHKQPKQISSRYQSIDNNSHKVSPASKFINKNSKQAIKTNRISTDSKKKIDGYKIEQKINANQKLQKQAYLKPLLSERQVQKQDVFKTIFKQSLQRDAIRNKLYRICTDKSAQLMKNDQNIISSLSRNQYQSLNLQCTQQNKTGQRQEQNFIYKHKSKDNENMNEALSVQFYKKKGVNKKSRRCLIQITSKAEDKTNRKGQAKLTKYKDQQQNNKMFQRQDRGTSRVKRVKMDMIKDVNQKKNKIKSQKSTSICTQVQSIVQYGQQYNVQSKLSKVQQKYEQQSNVKTNQNRRQNISIIQTSDKNFPNANNYDSNNNQYVEISSIIEQCSRHLRDQIREDQINENFCDPNNDKSYRNTQQQPSLLENIAQLQVLLFKYDLNCNMQCKQRVQVNNYKGLNNYLHIGNRNSLNLNQDEQIKIPFGNKIENQNSYNQKINPILNTRLQLNDKLIKDKTRRQIKKKCINRIKNNAVKTQPSKEGIKSQQRSNNLAKFSSCQIIQRRNDVRDYNLQLKFTKQKFPCEKFQQQASQPREIKQSTDRNNKNLQRYYIRSQPSLNSIQFNTQMQQCQKKKLKQLQSLSKSGLSSQMTTYRPHNHKFPKDIIEQKQINRYENISLQTNSINSHRQLYINSNRSHRSKLKSLKNNTLMHSIEKIRHKFPKGFFFDTLQSNMQTRQNKGSCVFQSIQ